MTKKEWKVRRKLVDQFHEIWKKSDLPAHVLVVNLIADAEVTFDNLADDIHSCIHKTWPVGDSQEGDFYKLEEDPEIKEQP